MCVQELSWYEPGLVYWIKKSSSSSEILLNYRFHFFRKLSEHCLMECLRMKRSFARRMSFKLSEPGPLVRLVWYPFHWNCVSDHACLSGQYLGIGSNLRLSCERALSSLVDLLGIQTHQAWRESPGTLYPLAAVL